MKCPLCNSIFIRQIPKLDKFICLECLQEFMKCPYCEYVNVPLKNAKVFGDKIYQICENCARMIKVKK